MQFRPWVPVPDAITAVKKQLQEKKAFPVQVSCIFSFLQNSPDDQKYNLF